VGTFTWPPAGTATWPLTKEAGHHRILRLLLLRAWYSADCIVRLPGLGVAGPGDRGKAQGLHYVRSAQSFPTAPAVLREQAHESSAAVHSPVDSLGRHAGEAVCGLWIGVCVESVDNRRGGKFGQVSPGIALSAFCA
jgi:hypothetical protein